MVVGMEVEAGAVLQRRQLTYEVEVVVDDRVGHRCLDGCV